MGYGIWSDAGAGAAMLRADVGVEVEFDEFDVF